MSSQSSVLAESSSKRTNGEGVDEDIKALIVSQIRAPFYHVEEGLLNLLRRCLLSNDQGSSSSALCGHFDHFESLHDEDLGWGCGWRNIQIICSNLLAGNSEAKQVLFNGAGFVPDIAALQGWLEIAWKKGYDSYGADYFKWKISGTRKWIGTTECAALLRSFGIRAMIVSFTALGGSQSGTNVVGLSGAGGNDSEKASSEGEHGGLHSVDGLSCILDRTHERCPHCTEKAALTKKSKKVGGRSSREFTDKDKPMITGDSDRAITKDNNEESGILEQNSMDSASSSSSCGAEFPQRGVEKSGSPQESKSVSVSNVDHELWKKSKEGAPVREVEDSERKVDSRETLVSVSRIPVSRLIESNDGRWSHGEGSCGGNMGAKAGMGDDSWQPANRDINHHHLVEWVWNYFTGESLNSCDRGSDDSHPHVTMSDRSPLYFQHRGHSRTIVGIQKRELRANTEQYFLLVIDPSQSSEYLAKTLRENHGWEKLIEHDVHTLKRAEYQLCYAAEGLACDGELEELKVLRSLNYSYYPLLGR